MTTFKRIALFTRRKITPPIVDTLNTVHTFLCNHGVSVVWEEETAAALNLNEETVPASELGNKSDLVIIIGGDGSLLNAAQILVDQQVPILGINRGQLGFLADINPDNVTAKLNEILQGHYTEEQRFLLYADIRQDAHAPIVGYTALNEVALHAGHAAQLIEFEVYIDERFVYRQRSDGLIVSTPTGSTAYALSGGGPILHPGLECIVLVPMLPHTLTSRPIVVSSEFKVDIVITANVPGKPDVSWDGHNTYSLNPYDRITIRRHAQKLKLIHPGDYDYYQTLRSKLQWGSKLTSE